MPLLSSDSRIISEAGSGTDYVISVEDGATMPAKAITGSCEFMGRVLVVCLDTFTWRWISQCRERMTQTMVVTFNVLAMNVAIWFVMSLFASRHTPCIVVDSGDVCLRTVSIFNACVLLSLFLE